MKRFTANLLWNLPVKTRKSVNIFWQNYGQSLWPHFFGPPCRYFSTLFFVVLADYGATNCFSFAVLILFLYINAPCVRLNLPWV